MNKTVKLSSIISRPILAYNSDVNNRLSHESSAEKQTQNKSNVSRFETQEMALNKDKEEIINNIISILSESKSKLWFDSGLAEEYVKRFNQKLPSDWIQVIKDSNGLIDVEVHNYTNVTKTFIALPVRKKGPSVKSTISEPNSEKTIKPLVESPQEPQMLPKVLSLPDSESWDLIITKVVNCCHLYIRLFEYEDDFTKLMHEMHTYYERNPRPVNDIIEGKIYAYKLEDATFRVSAQSWNNRTVRCILEDDGEQLEVNQNQLHEMLNRFLDLPFQALKCSLNGLELYGDNRVASIKLEELISSLEKPVLVGVPISRSDPISINLFDTSADLDRDLNAELIQYLYRHTFDDIMTTPGYECDVCITHCTSFGDIYVQIEGKFYSAFDKLKNRMHELLTSSKATTPSIDILKQELNKTENYYFAQFEKDWCRCVITNITDNQSISVLYVDFGNDQVISHSQIRSLESHSDPLIAIPYLAVKCRLNVNMSWSDITADLFYEQFTLNDIMKMRIISPQTHNNCASVQIFDKSSSLNDKLVTAYKAINMKSEVNGNSTMSEKSVSSVQNDRQVDETMMSALNYTEAGGDDVIFGGKAIPKPVLPPIKPNPRSPEDFFDVIVLLAATPNNFIVIPFENVDHNSKFNQMKLRMHDLYEKEENRIELPENVITKGLFIAGKCRNIWYRMQVKEIINRNPFQVMCLLVDYGEIQTFELKDIQPLYNEFRDLPIQAIKASLSSAEPKGSDWDVMASVEFRKMVENKSFVATVFDIKQVDDEPVLSVSLCDTSNDNDVYIGKSLVEKGLAKLRISNI